MGKAQTPDKFVSTEKEVIVYPPKKKESQTSTPAKTSQVPRKKSAFSY